VPLFRHCGVATVRRVSLKWLAGIITYEMDQRQPQGNATFGVPRRATDHFATLAPNVGLEPTTPRLRVCVAIALRD
jgi:hypothetical protein